MPTWLRLLRTRPQFRSLWMSGTISLVGDWLSFVAVSLLSLEHGGGAVALALMLAAHALPHAMLAPIAGTIADRMDRARLLVLANVSQALLTTGMLAAALLGAIWLVQVIVLARSAVGAFIVPAETAALRRVVDEDDLLDANAFVSSTWSMTFVIGMAAGGALAALGPALALAIDAATFLLAALLLRGLPPMIPERVSSPGVRLASVRAEMRDAWRFASQRGPLLEAMLAKTPVALAGGAAWVTLNVVAAATTPLGSAAVSLGILQAFRGAGTGVGPLVAARLQRGGAPMGRLATGAFALALAGMAAFALGGGTVWLLATALLWGCGSGANWVLSSSEMQRLAPDHVVGRVASIDDLSWTVSQVVSALLGAVVAESWGAASATWVGVGLGVGGWLWLRAAARARGSGERVVA